MSKRRRPSVDEEAAHMVVMFTFSLIILVFASTVYRAIFGD